MAHTFFWHDYETFGINPRKDRPAQFAGIRTDADLNEMGDPVEVFCRPAPDYVPDAASCLVTGITPQRCLERGVPEDVFARHIEAALAEPCTVGVGYNTIRFDDEFTRFLFWRNLIDPYGREWQNGCGRWDLLDVVRMAYALRPDGIVWPRHADGKPSFKLEHLSAANGLAHAAAHDAVSDVRATIALARLLRDRQPKLFEFAFSLHKKDRVAAELGLPTVQAHAKPFIHISGMFPAESGCLAVMWPLASHPSNKNELIAWDLAHDPRELVGLRADAIRERLFTASADLPEGVRRLPVKTVHLNKSPMVVGNLKTLTPDRAQAWGVDLAQALQHAQAARDLPDMSAVWSAVFSRSPQTAGVPEVDEDLYGGFVSNADRRRLNQLRGLTPEALALDRTGFEDGRLGELVWRYRARSFPQTLSPEDQARWTQLCRSRLIEGAAGARTVQALFDQIDELSESTDERGNEVLHALYDYAEGIAPEL
ncbi:MAG: hypothetical protein RLZZ401_1647 [Pseudomonadota bacterium]